MDTVFETRQTRDGQWEVLEYRVDDAGHKDKGEVVAGPFPTEALANIERDERNSATLRT